MTDSKFTILKPRMSEKTYAQYGNDNTYAFIVPGSANKLDVKHAVEDQFGVMVENVRMLVEKGKAKRSYHKKSRPIMGHRSNHKKAYVKVKDGDNIPIFAAVEEAEKKAKKAESKDKGDK